LGAGSVSDPDPYSMAAWIRIRIPNVDPDPGCLKRAKRKEKTSTKGRQLEIKMLKSNYIGMRWVTVTLFSLKVNFSFVLIRILLKSCIRIRIRIK
jgi:predicted small integral membrane protein